MQQAYGIIQGSDGSVLSGSGNFTVSKTSSGVYSITLQGTFSQLPVVVASPVSAYHTANVILSYEHESSNQTQFILNTGYTDKSGQNLDCDFSFQAIWS